jgi:ubiquitin conjugation factor E4 B
VSFFQIKDPDKYNFKPKELLAQICSVYLNMDRGDTKGVFAAAVAADKRSYRSQMFPEAANVLRQFGLLTSGQGARIRAKGPQGGRGALGRQW